jgi:hypothetical protein
MRRAGQLVARFWGAAANLGFWQAIKLYVFQLWSNKESSIYLPALRTDVFFRGMSDYGPITLLFKEDFYVCPNDFEVVSVFDLGANIGTETLRFASLYPRAKILAVEADPDNFSILAKNTTRLKQVRVENLAVWGENARFRVKKNPDCHMSSTVSIDANGELVGVTIDCLMDQMGIAEVDIIKIDIEGAEASVFGPSIKKWITRVRVIIWELNDYEVPEGLSNLVLAANDCGVRFNFHINGEKLVGVRTNVNVSVQTLVGLCG